MEKILFGVIDPLQIRHKLPNTETADPAAIKIAKFVMRNAIGIVSTWSSFAFDSCLPIFVPACCQLIPSSMISIGAYFGGKAIIQVVSRESDCASLALDMGTIAASYLMLVYHDVPEKFSVNGLVDELGMYAIKNVHENCTERPQAQMET